MIQDAYDGILHPQKRRLLREAVTAIMGRLIEVKHVFIKAFIGIDSRRFGMY